MTSEQPISVCVIYTADPLGNIPGGIDSYIRGLIRCRPPSLEIRIVGVTTDQSSRPVGRWTTCRVGDASFEFLPLLAIRHSERQARVPTTMRFVLELLRRRLRIEADVLEFHRIEPCLAFLRDQRPKTLVMHQNMNVLRSKDSDIRWKYWPGGYFALENLLIPRFSSISCVREDAATDYQRRFPALRRSIRFTPTWLDTEVFQVPTEQEREDARHALLEEYGLENGSFVLITVGRQDRQKSPLLLIDAFRELVNEVPEARLLLVGDGVLRRQIEDRAKRYSLESRVRLCGIKQPPTVARYLRGADLFVLSSAYEGMPISVLEALGSGLPVISTDVGEISRVVRPGVNGELVSAHDARSLAEGMRRCRDNIERYRGKPCSDSVQPYTPDRVLRPIYDNYRQLVGDL